LNGIYGIWHKNLSQLYLAINLKHSPQTKEEIETNLISYKASHFVPKRNRIWKVSFSHCKHNHNTATASKIWGGIMEAFAISQRFKTNEVFALMKCSIMLPLIHGIFLNY